MKRLIALAVLPLLLAGCADKRVAIYQVGEKAGSACLGILSQPGVVREVRNGY